MSQAAEAADPFRQGQEFTDIDSFVSAGRLRAEKLGFRVHRRVWKDVRCKLVCAHISGPHKCEFYLILRRITSEEVIGDKEWFVAETNTTHSGHLPTAMDSRQMGKEEERQLANKLAGLKASSPKTPSRTSSTRSDASSSTHVSVQDDFSPPRSPCTGPRSSEFKHLSPKSTIGQLLDTLDLLGEGYETGLLDVGAETVEDLVWLHQDELKTLLLEEVHPPVRTIHALRIISACKVLDDMHGQKVRVKMEEVD